MNNKTKSAKSLPRQLATYRYWGANQANQNRQTCIDDQAALWAARMCVGEGGKRCNPTKAAAMLWAVMNRWILHRARRYWPTYQYLMRRFSQPINPRWQKDGDLARKYAGTKYCTPARLRRRVKISSLTWDEIPDQIAPHLDDFHPAASQLAEAGPEALERERQVVGAKIAKLMGQRHLKLPPSNSEEEDADEQ